VKSYCTPQFWDALNALPDEARKLAEKNYQLWQDDPRHPSLHFKHLNHGYHSVRVGAHYRAIGRVEGDSITWAWIGHHAEYDHILKRI
jgi:hypothetical protein